jgi:acetolactate synthase-1/2/3 large subunit
MNIKRELQISSPPFFHMVSDPEDSQKTEKSADNILAGHGIASALKARGISLVFGIPDGHTLPFYDGLRTIEGIQHILVNDERTAAFAADAYARVTGTIGVCDAGAAGSMNFPVALAEAKGAGSAVLAIVGTVKSHDMLRNVPHDINVAATLAPITKWTGNVNIPDHLPRFLDYALRQAVNGKPGPVGLVVSEDVLVSKDIPLKEFIPRAGGACSINGCRIAPAASEIEYAVQLIRSAKQPALYTGEGALISGAFAEVDKISRLLHAPVFSTIAGKGILPQTPENLYFGTVGLFGERPNHKFLRKTCDLLIVVGNRLSEDDTANFKIPPIKLEMIQIDIDPAEIGLTYKPWGIVGDPKAALQDLIHELERLGPINAPDQSSLFHERDANIEGLRQDHAKYWEKDRQGWMTAQPIKPQRVLFQLGQLMSAEDFLVTDASASSRWIGPYFPVKAQARRIITPRGVGPTGFGVGAAIGTYFAAKELHPEKIPRIVLLTGDGGLMNGGLSDFETILKYKIDLLVVVINNSSLGFVKFGQAMLYKQQYYDTDRPTTDFARLAAAFGGEGYVVENLSDLDQILSKAYQKSGLQLVDIRVDPFEFLPPNSY